MSILVLGELNVDILVSGTDILPEWNKEKLASSFHFVLGSSSAITASILAGLGQDVQFVSVVGVDQFGDFCVEQLQRNGVNTANIIRDPNLQTGVTLSFTTGIDRGLVTYPGSIASLNPTYIPSQLLAQATHIHFGSYFLQDGMRDHWLGLFADGRKRGITTSFDTGWDIHNNWYKEKIDKLLEHTDLFIPSEEELLHIYGVSSLAEAWNMLPDSSSWVAIKRGANGSAMLDPTKKVTQLKAFDITPVDTTGAGDSFNAGFIYAFLSGKRDTELLLFANACGALSTQFVGGTGYLPTSNEIGKFLATHSLRS